MYIHAVLGNHRWLVIDDHGVFVRELLLGKGVARAYELVALEPCR